MNRRTFNKTAGTALAGTLFLGVKAKSFTKNSVDVRLGGPIYKKYNSPDEWISAFKEVNYTAAQCPVKSGADSHEIEAYKGAAKKADIIIAEVGAWSNPIDPDTEKAKAAIQKNIDSLQLADEIGANCCVNISGSRNPEKWAGPHKDNLTPATFDLIVETTRKIIDAVKPKNTFYTLETMPWSYPNSVDSYEKLVKAIDRKAFAVHFDPVNLVTGVEVYFKNGEMIKEAFQKLGKYMRSCHAKDTLLLEDKLT
ncbi:MAG: TIM barrel protein, partial [Draconibacterium sp.]|nr:TIM barrel protein [Draconibacterium sp.]